MKKQPVQNVNRPSYPTLYQVNTTSGSSTLKKIALVSALTASMALAAGCGEEGANKKMKRFEKTGGKFGGAIETEMILGGDTETYILEGEAQTIATDEYMLQGEETCSEEVVTTILDGMVSYES